ncbi:gustatory receptor 201 [Tribolium castaneum]|uniref:Gustatory receptor n=1 Tax=Tribolium castaneum TaxID=7070 RepID=D6WMU9_TRICA|nr:PREDICTED: uncharacterized protein LOC107397911 isoform X3 [Tribolium castaneum]EFA04730.1 gustatory receptor 201 [Tribolium castaneum]|eukprot:XP_015835364.1 PREDICTED: uncharacterized protein LOC107397911 isoform X3 [Tribolium castaneum]
MNITETAILICKIWSFIGLPYFKFENGKFEYKKSKSSIILIFIVIAKIVFFIKSIELSNDLFFYLTILQTGSLYLLVIGLGIYSYLKKRRIAIILNDLIMLTKMLCHFSRNNDLLRSNVSKPVIWYLIAQVTITVSKILGVVLTISPVAEVYLNLFFYNFAELFSYNINLLIFFYLIIFQNAYTSYFNAITSKNTHNDPKTVVEIFYKFYEISNNINKTLQVPILLRIFTDFVFAIASMFYLAVLLYIMPELPFFVVAEMVLWLVNTLFAIFIMAYFFDQMTEKRNKMMEIIDNLPSSHTLISKFLSSYKKKELLRLRLKHERFCFNVCGFFPLNNTFIYLMIAGIATYTTYLLQFGKIFLQKF